MLTYTSLLVLLNAMAAAGVELAPNEISNGDIYRLLATNSEAFDAADTNGDGRVSDIEFDRFKATLNSGQARQGARRVALGGYDLNNDGALTPYELYPEADYVIDTE
ncbi:MAG: hypothetical protein AAF986_01105 [Pseudomonadota bacterium]